MYLQSSLANFCFLLYVRQLTANILIFLHFWVAEALTKTLSFMMIMMTAVDSFILDMRSENCLNISKLNRFLPEYPIHFVITLLIHRTHKLIYLRSWIDHRIDWRIYVKYLNNFRFNFNGYFPFMKYPLLNSINNEIEIEISWRSLSKYSKKSVETGEWVLLNTDLMRWDVYEWVKQKKKIFIHIAKSWMDRK